MKVTSEHKYTAAVFTPEGWEVKSISELAQIKTGPFGTLLKASEYSGVDGVPLISVGEVGSGHFKVTEKTPRVPPEVVRRLPQYVLRTGDIVFGRKGAVERSALITEREEGWFLGSDGICVRPQRECHPPYLVRQFQRHDFQAWLIQNATGTTMASLNQSILGRAQIAYAPLAEQRAISSVLSDMDGLLASIDSLIAKKRDLKHAVTQQLLTGKTRLPGFDEDWRKGVLADEIVSLEAGVSVRSTDEGTRPGIDSKSVLKTSSVTGGRFLPHETKSIATIDIRRARLNPRANSVIISRMNTQDLVGECGFVEHDHPNIFLPDRLWMTRFRQGTDLCPRWLAYLLAMPAFKRRIGAAATGTSGSMKNLSKRSFLSLSVEFPTGDEQRAIAAVLSDMDAELTALEQRRDKTRLLKQGMMQELLTGRTRLV